MTCHAVCWRASFSAQEVLIRAWFSRATPASRQVEDAPLVLVCCLVDSRGDVESRQRRAALDLDGSGLHFVLGVAGVPGGRFLVEDGRSLHTSPHRGKLGNDSASALNSSGHSQPLDSLPPTATSANLAVSVAYSIPNKQPSPRRHLEVEHFNG
jgi:hypothetical protein